MPVWWLEGESESRVSWVLSPSWLLPLPHPASQLRQVTVCPLGNRSLAMKSACSFHSGTARHRAKASSCPCTSVVCMRGQTRGYLLIIRLIARVGIQRPPDMQEGEDAVTDSPCIAPITGVGHSCLVGTVSLYGQAINRAISENCGKTRSEENSSGNKKEVLTV